MPMDPKTRKVLTGCAVGCGVPAILLITTCVGFNVWLRMPGELLEPKQLIDERAGGYAEWRLELENPATELFFEALVEAASSQQSISDSPLIEFLNSWNQRRQARSLRRLFPANASWVLYEGQAGEPPAHLFSISVQRMGHQLQIADWISSFAMGRAGAEVESYRGEKIVTLGEGSSDDPADQKLFAFLSPEGVFVSTEPSGARRAVDRLRDPPAEDGGRELPRSFAQLDEHWQLRAVLINRDDALVEVIDTLRQQPSSAELRGALEQVEIASLGGGVLQSGDAEIELELLGAVLPVPVIRAEVDEWVQRLRDRDVPVTATTERTDRGALVRLRVEDVVGVLEQL